MAETDYLKEFILKDESAKALSNRFLEKARSNIITMNILARIKNQGDLIGIPDDYEPDDWIIVSGYYAMYMASLGLLANLGYKSKNHNATIVALEEIAEKNKVILANEADALREAKDRREIAQYSVTKRTTKELALKTKKEAGAFVDRMEEAIERMKT